MPVPLRSLKPLVEAAEEALLVARLQLFALVGDRNAHLFAPLFQEALDRYGRSFGAEPDGVGKQVADHDVDALAVEVHLADALVGREQQVDALLFAFERYAVNHLFEPSVEGQGVHLQLDRFVVHPVQVEHHVDQVVHAQHVLIDQHQKHVVFAMWIGLLQDAQQGGADQSERRAQLVADVDQKGGLLFVHPHFVVDHFLFQHLLLASVDEEGDEGEKCYERAKCDCKKPPAEEEWREHLQLEQGLIGHPAAVESRGGNVDGVGAGC